jgi:hypothetical protein
MAYRPRDVTQCPQTVAPIAHNCHPSSNVSAGPLSAGARSGQSARLTAVDGRQRTPAAALLADWLSAKRPRDPDASAPPRGIWAVVLRRTRPVEAEGE